MIAGDRALAERDRALPGLGLVLDGEALAARLPAARVRVDYLRYKPGTSCVAGIELETEGGRRLGAACAFRRDVPEKPAKAGARGGLLLDDVAVAVLLLPAERRLRSLAGVLDAERRAALLRRALPDHPALWAEGLDVLRYKPERRLVARLGSGALLKVYTEAQHRRARAAAEALTAAAAGGPRLPRLLGMSRRHRLLAFEWLEGRSLDAVLATEPGLADVAATAEALAALHALPAARLPTRDHGAEVAALGASAAAAAVAGGSARVRARRLAAALAPRLRALPARARALHGDFSADQVLVTAAGPVLADLDAAGAGDPAADLASFLADLELRALDGRLSRARASAVAAAFLDAYAGPDGDADALRPALAVQVPAALLRRAAEPFRRRHPDWPERVTAVLDRAEELAAAPARARIAPPPVAVPPARAPAAPPVAALDRVALTVPDAADSARLGLAPGPLRLGRAWPDRAGGLLLEYADERRRIVGARWSPGDDRVRLVGPGDDDRLPGLAAAVGEPGARLVGHRAGRRAVVRRGDGSYAKLVRPGRVARLLDGLDRARELAAGRFAVPEVLAVDAAAGRVTCAALDGRSLTDVLRGQGSPEPAAGAAGAALAALHAAPLPDGLAAHDAAAEARVLSGWLDDLARYAPARAAALRSRAQQALRRLAALPPAPPAPVHRDLHDGQVLIARDGGVGVLDFDTLAAGDPAIDLGNLLAHLDWRARQQIVGFERAAAAAAALLDGAGAGRTLRERAAVYAESAVLRLACVYAFRPRWSAVAAGVSAVPAP